LDEFFHIDSSKHNLLEYNHQEIHNQSKNIDNKDFSRHFQGHAEVFKHKTKRSARTTLHHMVILLQNDALVFVEHCLVKGY
jgi:wobble nucleotide-excising tRNase